MHQKDGLSQPRQKSTMDIELPSGTRDTGYLELLRSRLPTALDGHEPDLVVYQAGVDVHERDLLASLKLTADGIAARDRFVFAVCEDRRIPVVLDAGRGLRPKLEDTVALHAAP